MSADLDAVREMLRSISKSAETATERTYQEIRGRFSLKGRSVSNRSLHNAIEASVAQVFRDAAKEMAFKARRYTSDPLSDVCNLIDQELERLIRTITSNYFGDGWDTNFHSELVRSKDDAVRDYRHMSHNTPLGISINAQGNLGSINVAGPHGVANQAITGASLFDLGSLIGELRRSIDKEPMAEAHRLELQDHVEVLEIEASKPSADKGKLLRAVRRLSDFAEKVTVAAVAPIATAIVKLLGG